MSPVRRPTAAYISSLYIIDCILIKSISVRYRTERNYVGPITIRYRFKQNAKCDSGGVDICTVYTDTKYANKTAHLLAKARIIHVHTTLM